MRSEAEHDAAVLERLLQLPLSELEALRCMYDDERSEVVFRCPWQCVVCTARGLKLARAVWDAHDDALGL